MTEGDISPALNDPASLMLGLAALASIFAAFLWWRVASSINTGGETVTGLEKRALSHAAILTAVVLALAGVGYLLGRFTGSL